MQRIVNWFLSPLGPFLPVAAHIINMLNPGYQITMYNNIKNKKKKKEKKTTTHTHTFICKMKYLRVSMKCMTYEVQLG